MKIIPITYHEAARAKNIFFGLFQKEPIAKDALFSYLSRRHQEAVKRLAREEFRGENGETKSVWFPKGPVKRIRLFGWGEKHKWNYRKNPLVARHYVQYAKSERIAEFATPFGSSLGMSKKEGAAAFSTNAVMADFEFNKYKETPKEGWPEVKTIYLAADKKDFPEIQKGIREGMVIGEEVNGCRELANTPGGDMTPTRLAEAAIVSGKSKGIKIKILEEKDIKRLSMGGVLGVAKGSDEKPKFIIMEYHRGPKEQKPLVLVGKGVTFDSGGLTLKPGKALNEMHMDMSGGAAVIHGMAAAARLKLPVNIIGLNPTVENMPSRAS